jgi:Flp pilus assembly protein TadG
VRLERAALRGRQRGQALVFISVTTLIVLLAMLAMFSMGQLANNKTKLQNTADAVAYSVALTQARDLNFTAYMNRATIANQVAVAQIVSLTGWARHLDNMYSGEYVSISDTLANMSTLSALWTVPSDIAKPVASGLKSAFNAAGPVLVKVLDFLMDGMRIASMGYHLGMIATIPWTISDVTSANDPNAQLSLLGYAGSALGIVQHLTFMKTFSPSGNTDGDVRMGKVTQASMDKFYKNRTLASIYPLPLLIDPIRLFTPGAGPLVMFRFHAGGSALETASGNASQNLKAYDGVDASGTFVIFCITISILGIPIPIPFPLPPLPAGHGAAAAGSYPGTVLGVGSELEQRLADNSGTESFPWNQTYGDAPYHPYTATTYWQQVGEGPGTNMDSRAGLRDYYDVKGNASGATSNQATTAATGTNYHNDVAPGFILELERSTTTISTSSTGSFHIGGGTGGQLDLPDATVGNKLKAVTKAEAYFSRPKDLFARGDGKTEYGSLYSPYWQARLKENSILEQAASFLGSVAFP